MLDKKLAPRLLETTGTFGFYNAKGEVFMEMPFGFIGLYPCCPFLQNGGKHKHEEKNHWQKGSYIDRHKVRSGFPVPVRIFRTLAKIVN